MPYIGRPLNAGNLAVQSGTGDGADTTPIATLDYSVGSSNSIGVYLDGVRQLAGTDFTASGTTLTFTTAPANGVGIDVYFLGLELSIPTPGDDTVTGAKIVDDAIDSEHYTDGSIDTAHIANDAITLALMAPGTDGNIISYDASGNPVAIATGTDGQVLTSTGAGSPPAFETASSGGNFKNGMISFNMATANGTFSVTGLGFTPTHLIIHGVLSGQRQAQWAMLGTMTRAVIASQDYTTQFFYNNGFQCRTSGSVMQIIDLTSMDSDGFTLNNTKSGSPTGTNQLQWMAMG